MLLGNTLLLESLLVSLSCKEILLYPLTFFDLLAFTVPSLLLKFLHVQLVSEVFNVIVLSTSPFLLSLEFLEDLFSGSFSL
jgi:hypothetical protein